MTDNERLANAAYQWPVQPASSVMAALRRLPWVPLLLALIVGQVVRSHAQGQAKEFEATGSVVINSSEAVPGSDPNPNSGDRNRVVRAAADSMHSNDIAATVIAKLSLAQKPEDLLANYTATPTKDTDTVVVLARAKTATATAPIVRAIVDAWAAKATTDRDAAFKGSIDQTDVQLAAAESALTAANAALLANPGDKAADAERGSRGNEVGVLRDRKNRLVLGSQPIAFVKAFGAPAVPSSPISPQPNRDGLLGLLAGALAGIPIAWLLAGRGRRVRKASEAGRMLGCEAISVRFSPLMLASLRARELNRTYDLISPASSNWTGMKVGILPSPGENAGAFIGEVAAVGGFRGHRISLVDADGGNKSVTSVLGDSAGLARFVTLVSPADLTIGERRGPLVAEVVAKAIDSDAVLLGLPSRGIATSVTSFPLDGIIPIVSYSTARASLEQLATVLERTEVAVLGVVFVKSRLGWPQPLAKSSAGLLFSHLGAKAPILTTPLTPPVVESISMPPTKFASPQASDELASDAIF